MKSASLKKQNSKIWGPHGLQLQYESVMCPFSSVLYDLKWLTGCNWESYKPELKVMYLMLKCIHLVGPQKLLWLP